MRRLLLLLATLPALASAQTYDPLRRAPDSARTIDLVVNDRSHSRDLPLRVYLPSSAAAAPVILYSHGLGGATTTAGFLGQHWAARGYVAVFMQHPGSDESVWRNLPASQRRAALVGAASVANAIARWRDVPAVITALDQWNRAAGHPLAGRLDLTHLGMSGHSFGAVTTQGVSGQRFARGGAIFTDPRITAALVMSPSLPRTGNATSAFGSVRIPWMLMTGTRDASPIGDQSAESRLGVYPALPAGNKYELVLDGAEHSVFTDRALPGEREERNPAHHPAILALSTAFWDTYLRGDASARAWLNGDGPRRVLSASDRWQHK